MSKPYLLFAQHGWADTNQAMLTLAEALAAGEGQIVAPCLNYAMTWLRIAPLIDEVDALATATLVRQPDLPVRVVGHSMGGLIWLEVLNRHPEWWPRIEFLALVGSPVGGADLGRILDPLQVGVGIAADLGRDRRPLAARVIEQIQQFWAGSSLGIPILPHPIVDRLRQIPGMTDAHQRDFARATVWHTFADGSSLRLWRSPFGIHHVFLASSQGDCLYSGYVGWLHTGDLWPGLEALRAEAHLLEPEGV